MTAHMIPLGQNCNIVHLGGRRGSIAIGFSYETPVAFRVDGGPWTVSRNVWSVTTGKHINKITSQSAKDRQPIEAEDFKERLEQMLDRLNLGAAV